MLKGPSRLFLQAFVNRHESLSAQSLSADFAGFTGFDCREGFLPWIGETSESPKRARLSPAPASFTFLV